MKKGKKKISWREAMRVNQRTFGLYCKKYPSMIFSRFMNVAWNALTPYVGIYLSALIIDELAGNRDLNRLKWLVGATLVSTAAIALISAILNKWQAIHHAGQWYRSEHILWEKLLDMDYVDLDKTETAALLSTIRQNQIGAGLGFDRALDNYEALCSHLLTILGGISLAVSLFSSRVPASAGRYTVLNHPLFIALVIVAMFAINYVAPALSNRAGFYWRQCLGNDKHNLANRLFSFFGSFGFRRKVATDVRLYRQDKITDRYNRDKEDIFSSKGDLSRCARGPMGLYRAASAAVSVIFTGVVYAFVCLKAWAGAFGLGAVTQYVASITKVSGGMLRFISTLDNMRNNAVSLKLNFEYLDIPNNMYQGSLTVEKRRDRKYQVEFRNVSFKYPGSENYALRNVNMKFEIGKRLAVVGMNGSGKTTFIKLLCRLYDPTEGEILLNGIDIRKYNYREYMNIFSVVFQDFKLLSLKLGENVAGKIDYDKGLVVDCLEKAGSPIVLPK